MYLHGRSDTGRVRDANDDVFAHDESRGLVVLADGMGGSSAGGVAARLAVDGALEFLEGLESPLGDDVLRAAIQHANQGVYRAAHANDEHRGMGTTLVLLHLNGSDGLVAHVGDSRAYRLRDGSLEQITSDHSMVQELIDRGILTRSQARTAPNRNIITRAIGIEAEVEVDVVRFDAEPGDTLLLCSDGLSDLVDDQRIERLLRHEDDDLEACADALVDAANDAGGTDNITVVLVRI